MFDRRHYVHISKTVVYSITIAVFFVAFFIFGMLKETFFAELPVRYDYNSAEWKQQTPSIMKIWLRRTAVAKETTTLYVSRMLVNTQTDEQIILQPSEEIATPGANNVKRVFFLPNLDPGEWCFVITTRFKPALSLSYRHIEMPKTCFTIPEPAKTAKAE